MLTHSVCVCLCVCVYITYRILYSCITCFLVLRDAPGAMRAPIAQDLLSKYYPPLKEMTGVRWRQGRAKMHSKNLV